MRKMFKPLSCTCGSVRVADKILRCVEEVLATPWCRPHSIQVASDVLCILRNYLQFISLCVLPRQGPCASDAPISFACTLEPRDVVTPALSPTKARTWETLTPACVTSRITAWQNASAAVLLTFAVFYYAAYAGCCFPAGKPLRVASDSVSKTLSETRALSPAY